MYYAKQIRWVVFLLSLILLIVSLTVVLLRKEDSFIQEGTCLGVPVVSDVPWKIIQEVTDVYNDDLYYNGEKAAIDTASGTIYISQDVSSFATPEELTGEITLSSPDCALYFLEDDAFLDLQNAVSEGHEFQLAVVHENRAWLYRVVFTTLPVIRMESSFSSKREDGRRNYYGQICLWSHEKEEPVSSNVQFHPRGDSTLDMEKKSWKLSLKNESMKNNHLSLLDMGADDDWILNAMSMDDTKTKEMLLTQIWNQISEDSPWDPPMSTCKYVEVVLNGSYSGIYLLQRRVDQKYLALSETDALLKWINGWTADRIEDAYEIRYTGIPEDECYSLMKGVFERSDCSIIDLENFVDISIFLQLGCLADNTGFKNMYYWLRESEGEYSLFMIPWDTDFSMGVVWADGFAYDFDTCLQKDTKRREYAQMLEQNPQLEEMISSRWQQLRQNLLSDHSVLGLLEEYTQQLTQSGAYTRDIQKNGLYYNGADTMESLSHFVEARLEVLDSFYG